MTLRLISLGLVLSMEASLVTACGGGATSGTPVAADAGPDGTTAGQACIPGAQVACACTGGGTGAQVCAVDGRSLGPCQGCPSGSGSGSGSGSSSGGSGSSSGGSSSGSSSGGSSSGSSSGGSSSGSSSGGGSDAGGGDASDGGDAGFGCDPNPLNYDVPGNGCDDDGDGTVDDVITCDGTLPTGASQGTAAQLLNAMEVCHAADATHWGIVSAALTNSHATAGVGDGKFAYQHGILQTFGTGGVKAQRGSAFGVLSSGTADIDDTQDAPPYFKGTKAGMQVASVGDVPNGFPKPTSGCGVASSVYDVIDLKAQIKVPANAGAVSFDFDFHSSEWPEYACNTFDDAFIAYLASAALNGGTAGNISFDSKGNSISVNAGFLDECSPGGATTGCAGAATGTAICPAGAGALAGTGFDHAGSWCGSQTSSGGAATGWLTTTAPVKPGETITLELIIWDTGDASYDSSVLLDNIRWQPAAFSPTPVTQPAVP